jgi:hypothetical protein
VIDRRGLVALRAKYLEMKRLREENDAGQAGDPTPAMRALAARFPGALREIDELSMATIDGRIAELDRAIEAGEAAPWMVALARYHAWLRLALQLRRDVRERTLGPARAWLAARGQPDEELGEDAVDDETLRAILRPPAGRLNRVILLRVAAELDTADDWIESLLREPPERRIH